MATWAAAASLKVTKAAPLGFCVACGGLGGARRAPMKELVWQNYAPTDSTPTILGTTPTMLGYYARY